MPIIFYTTKSPSPPSRAVAAIIRIIKLDVEYRYMDLMTGDYLEPWYLKINPAHQVPALDDNGFIVTDSHAIIPYLLNVYATKDISEKYYPTDPKLRAIVDSRWHFENGMLFSRLKAILLPLLKKKNHIALESTEYMIDALDILETILDGKKWLAGDELTVADISTLTVIDMMPILVPLKYYKNITAWAERARKAIPFYKEVEGLEVRKAWLKNAADYDAEERWDKIRNIVA